MAEQLDVEALPRRTAHVVHAVMAVRDDTDVGPYGPFKACEVMLYDAEAVSPGATGRALAHALHLGLVDRWGPGLWSASRLALDYRSAFETRYLRETEHL